MDLNALLMRHQIALHMADKAASSVARQAHLQMAEAYAARIADRRLAFAPQAAA